MSPESDHSRDPDSLLRIFHEQLRLEEAGSRNSGTHTQHPGHVRRHWRDEPDDRWAMVESPEGLGPDPDAVITAERDHFAALGFPLEWKTYSYDAPADLGERLVRAGFAREDDEALMLGDLRALAGEVKLPDGVSLRQVRTRGDARRVQQLYELVWGGQWGRADADPYRDDEPIPVSDNEYALLAEQAPDGPVLCAARVSLHPGTDFAGMWGGTTHPDWRRRGLLRALLAQRARWALERGATLARVDASPESEPILRSLGLHRVATTTPYKYPPRGD